MKVVIISNGSRGDVQPYVALALALRDRGHSVTIAARDRFRWLVEAHNLDFRPLHHEPFINIVHEYRKGILRPWKSIWQSVRASFDSAFDEWLEAARGADLLVVHPLIIAAPDIAQAYGIPLVVASPTPGMCATGEFPNTLVAGASLGGLLNRSTYYIASMATVPINALRHQWRRRRLGMKSPMVPMSGRSDYIVPHCHGFSPLLLPRPSDWPDQYSVDGVWRVPVPPEERLPQDLLHFISQGPAPIFVGFGSMVLCPPEHTRQILDAAMRCGSRVIVAKCDGALNMAIAREYDPSRVFPLEGATVSFDQLFPLVSVVAHHSGIGTMSTALRAGKPQICCPFRYDQPFWSDRAHQIGIAPEPLPISRLSVAAFQNRLQKVLSDPGYGRAAEKLRDLVLQEDGVQTTVARLERLAASHASEAA